MSRAKYYISFDAGVNYSEFFPTNEPKISLVREGDEIFKRWKVDKFRIGRTKNQVVFDTISGMFFDSAYFATDLLYKVNILGTDKFFFIDPVTNISLDNQNMVYECTPDANDEYRPILQQYDKKWQDRTANKIFGDSDGIYYPKLNTASFLNIDFTTFLDAAGSVSYTNTTLGSTTARNDLDVVTTTGMIVIVVIKNRAIVGRSPAIQLIDGGGVVKSNQETIGANGVYYLTQTANGANILVELSQLDLSGASSGSFDYEIYYPVLQVSGESLYNCLNNVINGASYINAGIVIQSTILWNDALPTNPPPNIDAYITANPTKDYVLQTAAIWNYLHLARTDSFTTAKEDIIETSLKDVMAILRKLRMWWFIDNDGEFRIEHEYYFRDYTAQADMTSVAYAPDKPEVDQRVYRYEKGDSYTQINYSEQNQDTEDWVASPVEFSATLTTNNAKDVSYSTLTTDFEYVRDNPGDASSSGLMLLRMTSATGIIAIDQSTLTPTNYYANAYLSWAWLFVNYYDYFAEAETGTINNGIAHTYVHVKEYLKQGNIKFRMVADLDWKRPFTLALGTGWVEAAEYAPETGMYKIDVGFNPYSLVIYVVDSEDIGTFIVDDDGSTFITI
jgi:hypothetical protein